MNPNVKFGFGVAISGQRNNDYVPELVALSTKGGFRITPQVSKKLGIAGGDYVMFINNFDQIEAAVKAHADVIVEFCEANGLDIDAPETLEAVKKEFGTWAIAKGIQCYDSKGVALKCSERLSDNQRESLIRQNFDTALAAAMENEELRDALTAEGVDEEAQVKILVEAYQAPQVDKYLGSKTANSSKTPGTGVVLTFSDANIWNALRGELKDTPSMARSYAIDLDAAGVAEISNGYEMVKVTYLPLGEYTDSKVVARTKKEEE